MRILSLMAVVAVGLALGSTRAEAQESHKFNAKTLEASYALPVYAPKGGVFSNEVVESTDEVSHLRTAIYSMKGEPKKALEFYEKALGEPKHETTDEGGDRYLFKKPPEGRELIRRRVVVQYDRESKVTQVTLWVRRFTSPEDASGE